MKHDLKTCPICGEGILSAHRDMQSQTYNAQTRELPFEYSECDCCGCVTTIDTQAKNNKKEMIKFKKDVDGLLSGSEIRKIRKSFGLSIKMAGLIFGGGPVAFSKYENDDLVHSTPMDSALRMATYKSIIELAIVRNVTLDTEFFQNKRLSDKHAALENLLKNTGSSNLLTIQKPKESQSTLFSNSRISTLNNQAIFEANYVH